MSNSNSNDVSGSWLTRFVSYLLLVVAAAVAARVIWQELGPLLPSLLGLVFMFAVIAWLFRRH